MPVDFEKIRRDLSNARMDTAMKQLRRLTPAEKGDFADAIDQLYGDYKQYKKDDLMGIEDARDMRRVLTRIRAQVLALLRKMEHPEPEPEPIEPDPVPLPDPVTSSIILFVAANPRDSGRLRLDEEQRNIEEVLNAATLRNEFELKVLPATRTTDLSLGLLRYRPRILHFSGHGVSHVDSADVSSANTRGALNLDWEDEQTSSDYQGGIALENESGNTQLVSAEALADIIRLFPTIECVVLNACYSEAQAKAIIPHGPSVIGMNTAVPDNTAITFATSFYQALGEGRSIPDAFAFAKACINLNGLSGGAIPQLVPSE